MNRKDRIDPNPAQNFSPMSAVKYLGIAFALIFAFKVFALAIKTDSVQTLIKGESLPRLPMVNQIEHAEQIIRDQKKLPPRVDGTGPGVP